MGIVMSGKNYRLMACPACGGIHYNVNLMLSCVVRHKDRGSDLLSEFCPWCQEVLYRGHYRECEALEEELLKLALEGVESSRLITRKFTE